MSTSYKSEITTALFTKLQVQVADSLSVSVLAKFAATNESETAI